MAPLPVPAVAVESTHELIVKVAVTVQFEFGITPV